MIDAEELREKIANTIVVTRDGTHVGSVGSYVGTLVMDAIMRTTVEELAEAKEPVEWKPKDREQYLYIGPLGRPCIDTWRDTDRDEHRLSVGNCYPLDTPDEVIIKEQKLIPQAMHRLKMAAKKAWFEFNGSEGPDWSNPVHPQWLIHYYRRSGEIFAVKGTPQIQTGMPSFPTERSCRAYIDSNKDDLELLFGVE